MNQHDIEKLQKLLAVKNLEKPSPHYFENVVSSFHRRLENREAQVSLLNRFLEYLDFSPKMQFAYGSALACIVAIGIFTTQSSDKSSPSAHQPLLAVQKTNFVDDQAGQLFQAQNAENIRELILSSDIMAETDPIKTSYVLDVQPVSYENGLSF